MASEILSTGMIIFLLTGECQFPFPNMSLWRVDCPNHPTVFCCSSWESLLCISTAIRHNKDRMQHYCCWIVVVSWMFHIQEQWNGMLMIYVVDLRPPYRPSMVNNVHNVLVHSQSLIIVNQMAATLSHRVLSTQNVK